MTLWASKSLGQRVFRADLGCCIGLEFGSKAYSGDSHCKIRSRPGKPNQRKVQNEKFMNFASFWEFWCFSLGKQARFTLNFCSGMPLRKVHELTFLWFGLLGPLLIKTHTEASNLHLAPRNVIRVRTNLQHSQNSTSAAKIITKSLFTKIIFGGNSFCNYYKNTLHSAIIT